MLVKDIYTKTIITLTAEVPLRVAAALMYKHKIHSLLVMSKENRKPIGIVTRIDILRAIKPNRSALEQATGDFVHPKIIKIDESSTIQEAAQVMCQHRITHLLTCKEHLSRPLQKLAQLENVATDLTYAPISGILSARDILANAELPPHVCR